MYFNELDCVVQHTRITHQCNLGTYKKVLSSRVATWLYGAVLLFLPLLLRYSVKELGRVDNILEGIWLSLQSDKYLTMQHD